MDQYQRFIHLSRYARWNGERRENWKETVARYINYIQTKVGPYVIELPEFFNSIVNLEVMPSMRAMMSAGEALEKENVAGYNCAYLPIDSIKAFAEVLYILMNGTGVGFSVERKYLSQLPEVLPLETLGRGTLVVEDSKKGWAEAVEAMLHFLYSGIEPYLDTSRVRPKGSPLKTFGGRASGPEPLHDLYTYMKQVFRNAKGRCLSSLEVHDIVCKIASCVVVGGVRRSALISLSELDDKEMRYAKSGDWYNKYPHRALANISAVYENGTSFDTFSEEWSALVESKSGERGIVNRDALKFVGPNRRGGEYEWGVNPCCEVKLRPRQFCNLTEVVARPWDSLDTLARKVYIATALGTIQSTLTNFNFISPEWKKNCEEERLLGVSLTGIMDCPLLHKDLNNVKRALCRLKEYALYTNRLWARRLGINESTAVTTVKPSGTVSQLVNASPGIHSRYSQYYLRTVRSSKFDSMFHFLRDQGVYWEDDVHDSSNTAVFYFPVSSPEGVTVNTSRPALEQLRLWLTYQTYWCEHKPSATIYIKDEEWEEVGNWVYKNLDKISGLSFFPVDVSVYKQAPYIPIEEEEFMYRKHNFPTIDWSKLSEYERSDNTIASQELNCSGGQCEL